MVCFQLKVSVAEGREEGGDVFLFPSCQAVSETVTRPGLFCILLAAALIGG